MVCNHRQVGTKLAGLAETSIKLHRTARQEWLSNINTKWWTRLLRCWSSWRATRPRHPPPWPSRSSSSPTLSCMGWPPGCCRTMPPISNQKNSSVRGLRWPSLVRTKIETIYEHKVFTRSSLFNSSLRIHLTVCGINYCWVSNVKRRMVKYDRPTQTAQWRGSSNMLTDKAELWDNLVTILTNSFYASASRGSVWSSAVSIVSIDIQQEKMSVCWFLCPFHKTRKVDFTDSRRTLPPKFFKILDIPNLVYIYHFWYNFWLIYTTVGTIYHFRYKLCIPILTVCIRLYTNAHFLEIQISSCSLWRM